MADMQEENYIDLFQFLIGRLVTLQPLLLHLDLFEFQFLIGRLVTKKRGKQRYFRRKVSIPHR